MQAYTHNHQEGKAESAPAEQHRTGGCGVEARPEEDAERPYGHAEHGNRDRHERKMIPQGHGEYPGQKNLEHQRCERDERKTTIEEVAPPYRRRPGFVYGHGITNARSSSV